MKRLLKAVICGASTFVFLHTGLGHASEQDCSVKDRTEALVLMLCPEQPGEKTWIEAAKLVCGSAIQCNVWIWNDRSKMPDAATKTDAELSKKHTGAAVAIWINDAQSLIKLKKVH